MSKVGLRIKTSVGAGRYQHKVTCIGDYRKASDIPEAVVDAQRILNERLWEHIPEGAHSLTSEISYVEGRGVPFLSRITRLFKRRYQ